MQTYAKYFKISRLKVVFICTLGINVLTSQSFQTNINIQMKKYTLLYILAALTTIGCNQQKSTNDSSSKDSTSQTTKSVSKKAKKQNKITKYIPIATDFTHLICVSGANITYTQGDYNIEAIGDSAVLQYLCADFDSNILTLSIGSERNQDINIYEGKLDVTINISAPNLQCVTLCSSGDFTSHGLWKANKIEFGIIGKGSFHCDSIESTTFDLQSTGDGNANFTNINSKSIHIANMSGSNINADVNTELLMCENKGYSTITFTGKASRKELFPTKTGKILF